MSEKDGLFNATIKVTDEGTVTIEGIRHKMEGLGHEVERFDHQVRNMHSEHAHLHKEMGEHVDALKEHWGEFGKSVGEAHESLLEMLPAFGAISAAASLAGAFESVEKTAESYGELAHSAATLGMAADDLNQWRIVAKLTDTDAEGLGKSVSHLNRVFGEISRGENKKAADLLHHLHIDPRKFSSGADALYALADAFEHTRHVVHGKLEFNIDTQTDMAKTLFGKQGVDQIPMLSKGGKELRKRHDEAGELGIKFKPFGEGLEKYNEDMKGLQVATGSFVELLGSKLAPAFDPLIEKSKEFVVANRGLITTKLADSATHLVDALDKVDWKKVTEGLGAAASLAGDLADNIDGVEHAFEAVVALLVYKGARAFITPVLEMGKVSKAAFELGVQIKAQLGGAWDFVATAATRAGDAELAASRVAPAAAGAAGIAAVETGAAAKAAGLAAAAGGVAAKAGFLGGVRGIGPKLVSLLLAPEVFAGYVAHSVDSNDGSGKWIDKHVPGAGAVDDWIARHSGGWVGRKFEDEVVPPKPPSGQLAGVPGVPAYALPNAPIVTPFTLPGVPRDDRTYEPRSLDKSQTEIVIRLDNFPPNTRVDTTSSANAPVVRTGLGLGQAFQFGF